MVVNTTGDSPLISSFLLTLCRTRRKKKKGLAGKCVCLVVYTTTMRSRARSDNRPTGGRMKPRGATSGAGERLKTLRLNARMTTREVERISLEISRAKRNPEYYISHAWLTD